MPDYPVSAQEALTRIRSAKPVVHSVTNFVVMNSTANVLLSMGASPIMAHAPEELEEIVSIASSVVINIGTLSRPWIESMVSAGRICASLGKPLVLDPVGAGATKLRTETARNLAKAAMPAVIRGNASEILALTPEGGETKGVDSGNTVEEAINAAKAVAGSLGTVVAVTGEKDLVTNGRQTVIIEGGHPLLSCVTGTGCAATVTIGAFLAVEDDVFGATVSALGFFSLAGERAAVDADGPGTFWARVLDELFKITPDELGTSLRVTEI